MFGWFKKWVAPAPPISTSRASAREALVESQESLRVVDRREAEVKAVTDQLRNLREVNHFAERMEIAMRGH